MKLASYFESQHFKTIAVLLIKQTRIIGFFIYALAIVGFFILPREDISRSSYFDENALMSGLATTQFGDAVTAISVIEEELSKIGLEVYQQNFSALPPIALVQQSTPTISGRNIYGVLRAPRASTTEALVLSAPFSTRDGTSNVYGIAAMLSLANYLKTKNYWAKDLVFLFTSEGELGTEAWMDAYLGQQMPGIVASSLQGHSGSIQAVFNLELESPFFDYVEIIVGGTNGILPNLDMVNTVTRLCLLEGIQTTFHSPWSSSLTYRQSLIGMLLFGARLAPGLPTGNHALFLRHRIDAVTIRGVGNSQQGTKTQNMIRLGRAMEGIIRSFNNLLETLHHSLYFYLLPSSWSFVSIAFYTPPFGLFLLPLALEALKQWLVARVPDILLPTLPLNTLGAPNKLLFPFNRLLVLLLVSFGSGGLLCYLPALACTHLGPLTNTGLVAGLLLICGVSVLVPLLLGLPVMDHEWRIVKCFNLLLLVIMLAAFAVLNYPLAVCLALCLSLPCTITQPSGLSSQCAHWFSQTSLLLLSPPMWALYFCALYTFSLSAPSADLRDVIVDSITMAMTGVASSYNAWHLLGCWLYWAMCLCVWPLWMMAWSLTCLQQAMGLGEGNQKGYSHSKDSQVFDGSPSPTSRSIVKDSSSHSID
ncbi:hypothetical protein EMCRGX_G031638 [Ephydatia muelleri]